MPGARWCSAWSTGPTCSSRGTGRAWSSGSASGREECLARNPRLVHARMTGWGQTGPWAQRAGHDITYAAVSGTLHALGPAERPVAPVPVIGDFAGGSMYLVVGVLAALIARGTTGRGQVVDAAMVDGAAHLFTMVHGLLGVGGWRDEREANLLDGGAPFYAVYECADGRFVAVGALEPPFWAELVAGLGVQVEGEQYDPDTWPAQRAAFTAAFRTRTRDEWAGALRGHRRVRRPGALADRGAPAPAPRRPRHVRAGRARPPGARAPPRGSPPRRGSTPGPSRCRAPTPRPTCWPTGSARRRSPTSWPRARSSRPDGCGWMGGMSTDAVPTVLVETTGVVGRITLNAPERLNAVDPGMCEVVADAVRAFDDDPAVRVIALTGAGRGFCSGAPLSADGATQGTLYAGADLVRALLASRTPVVALVNGVAAGIGVPMALACDYVLASDAASFVLAFARIGLMPDGGSTALVAASIGRARAMRLALTGEKLDAVTAAEWGLVAECVAARGVPGPVRGAVGRRSRGRPRWHWRETKAAVNAASVDVEAALEREEAGQIALMHTQDYREGVAAFLAKRPAEFTGH